MRKVILGAILASVIFGGVSYVSAAGKNVPAQKGVIVGEVIDISTYAMQGKLGAEQAEAGLFRCELGFPVGILEEKTGVVWVAVYRNPVPAAGLQTANLILAPLLGKKAVIQGWLYRAKGVNLIRVGVVSEY